jgi:ribosomal-protein-alanine N-acetyltransferase
MLSPSAETLLIRPMQDEDLEQVLAIDQASFALPWPASAYRFELCENPGSQSWVAETRDGGGQPIIVGLCVAWLILEEAHIATIAVHPDYRGIGIGQVILSAALLGAMRRGCVEATLEVRAGNLPAQRLYQRFGFQLAGIRPRYYRDNNEDAWIMTVSNLGSGYASWLENEGWRSPAA